jgi:hypothetical protein
MHKRGVCQARGDGGTGAEQVKDRAPALTPPLRTPGNNPGCIEHQSDGMSRKGDMWYNATASALTPPLQSIPRRCQRRGDRLLPEPICQTPGCTIARIAIAVPVQPLPVDD